MRVGARSLLVAFFFVIQGELAVLLPTADLQTVRGCERSDGGCSTGDLEATGCVPCALDTEWQGKEALLLRHVLTDFSGRRFIFDGTDEESYNLFTEADHQLNIVLANGIQKSRQLGLTLRGVGIHGPDTRVKILISDDEHIAVEINERSFNDDATRLDGVVISRGCSVEECVNVTHQLSVTVKDRFMTLTAWIEPANGKDTLSLAFKLLLAEPPMSQVHGILGQSLDEEDTPAGEPRVSMPSNLQFYGEGQISDYSTTDIFSSDSTFSIFTRKADRRRQKRKRQMLEGNALASMAFAAKTESGASQTRRFPK